MAPENDAISAHGTIIRMNGNVIGRVRDIKGPARTRNVFDASTHNDEDNIVVVGIRRKGPLTFMINYLPGTDLPSPDADIDAAYESGSKDTYTLTYPDGGGIGFDGFVTNVNPAAPVDGLLSADVTITPSGASTLGSPTFGSPA
jgi:hypothetical protein